MRRTTRSLALIVAALAAVALAANSSSGEAPQAVGLPETLIITGVPGSTPSGTFLVHVSNSTQSLSIPTARATALQDDAGHQIPVTSINLTPSTSIIDPDSFLTLTVTVFLSAGTTPGNYSGQVVLLAENGSTTTLNLNLSVKAPYWAYAVIIFLIAVGVTLSFIYSPLKDEKPSEPVKSERPKLEEIPEKGLALRDYAMHA